MTYRRAEGTSFELVDGRAVVLASDGSELTTLNPVGTLVWVELAGTGSPEEIASRLATSFTQVTEDELLVDVAAFLEELAASGLVERSATPPGPA